MTDPLFAAPDPVFEVVGRAFGELARDVVRLEVEDTTAGLKTLTVRFVAHGPRPGAAAEEQLYLDGDVLDFGKKLAVSIGPAGAARTVFTGVVSGLEAGLNLGVPPEVVVFAEDDLMRLRLARRCRTYENVTDADLAARIAADHGLTPHTDADGPRYDVVQQWNQSDLAFLRDRARNVAAEVWCHDGTLYFQTRDKRQGPELTLVAGNNLLRVRVRADLAHQRTGVHVSGYDAAAKDAIDEDAKPDVVVSEVGQGRSGPAVLETAFAEYGSLRVREAPLRADQAAAWAKAEFLRRARGFVTATGTTRGSPDLVVGARLTLSRVGPPFDGPGYYATTVRHTYDRAVGFRTHFVAERAGVGS